MQPPPASVSRSTVPKMGCGYAVCALLAFVGVWLLLLASTRWQQRRAADAWIAGGIGALFCLAGAGLIAPMQREVARARVRRDLEEKRPGEPWTWDPAWLDRNGIVQSGRRHGGGLLFFAVAAIAMSIPGLFALPREIAKGNHAIWLVLLFPLAGAGILAAVARDAWRRRKYGTARFVPAGIPVPLGGEVAGMIIVDRAVIPIGPGRVSLDCWRTTSESTRRRRQTDVALAHTEREVAPADWTTTVRESQLYVQLPIRGGGATTMMPASVDEPAYEWRLRVEVPTAGADFVAEFVLPVFEVEGQSSRPAAESGRIAARDRAEIWRVAGIREESQPGANAGDALVFPAGLGRSLVTMPLLMALGFGALAAVIWFSPAPGIIAVFFAVFSVLPALALPSLWSGGGERVWIESGSVCVQRGHRALRRIATRDVQTIELNKNVGVGTQQFYRVVARCRPLREGRIPPRVEIASMVRGEEAANAVVAWLQERLTQ